MVGVESDVRYKKVRFAAWVGIVGNVILAIVKAIIGVMSNSKALIADAAHSASDVVGSVVVLIGVRAAKLPPDRDHPYGHGKAESVAAIIVAVLLFIVGFEIAIRAIHSFFEPVVIPKTMAIYAVLFSIIVKECMFRYKHYLGKKYKSEALVTDAWHHRSDVFSSLAALIGIGAALLGGYMNINWLVYGDAIASAFVAILIAKMAWSLGQQSIHNALDHVLHEEDTVEMKRIAQEVDGVMNIDEFYAREHGHYVIIDIKVAVDPYITVEEGHAIAKQVKARLMEDKQVQDVLVHINPYDVDRDEEKKEET
ncbi:cation diffusion facilitator family transporter [Alkalihalobacillus hemicellulosilyticus]|uniref:Cobalt-zinc-cadmium resistance protein n=1 Tax=Halalkalibacter hemicellulosilyticusJCM 9152 TaxID=1236971 RepID=W4QEH2_9BACI|nr:cation diffusion facilitator family transporter [Halalkalibacter hemicellulosilyticus]GAE30436.1 cobalt-zinc-cadmium resistance protein [Halalkalibacter hemicellulosilyticusJCM 9152]